jgi:hypothetical protein
MSWFKQMSGSNPIAGVSGQDDAGINDAIYGTSAAILSAAEARSPPSLGAAEPARTDETKRSQLVLLGSYVAKVRIR